MAEEGPRAELGRVRRVADMLCTAHAGLSDDFARCALILDVAVLGMSAWVISLSFVDSKIAPLLVPGGLTPTVWVGLMGLGAFVLTLVQMRLDLRGRADGHRRALDLYAEVKRDAAEILATPGPPDAAATSRLLSRYGFASSLGVGIPEDEFLRRKQRHLLKIRVSQHLDAHPAASLAVLKMKWWWTDNIGSNRTEDGAWSHRRIDSAKPGSVPLANPATPPSAGGAGPRA